MKIILCIHDYAKRFLLFCSSFLCKRTEKYSVIAWFATFDIGRLQFLEKINVHRISNEKMAFFLYFFLSFSLSLSVAFVCCKNLCMNSITIPVCFRSATIQSLYTNTHAQCTLHTLYAYNIQLLVDVKVSNTIHISIFKQLPRHTNEINKIFLCDRAGIVSFVLHCTMHVVAM